MVVAVCVIRLNLYGVQSLKEKRQIVKSILARLSRQFNVAVAEVGYQDIWQTTELAAVTVGNDSGHLHARLEKVVAFIEQQRPDVPIDDYFIEFL
ncbi:MAG: DUF503 domain-containing protein [Candidatus Promineifilaceae bacterium]|nr:DUF503 domain-containing protein [Candidatus Promineifilaceae bacterium]